MRLCGTYDINGTIEDFFVIIMGTDDIIDFGSFEKSKEILEIWC